jgi:hypothetical protein
MRKACGMNGRDDICIQDLWRENRKKRGNMEDPYVDWRIFNIME